MSTKCAAWNIITCPICLIWLRYQTILKTVQICPDSDTATAVNPDSGSMLVSGSFLWSVSRFVSGSAVSLSEKNHPLTKWVFATAALVPDVGRTPDVWSHNLSWPRINFAHNEFLSLQWIYSDIDLKKKRKKYFWWENIFSIELVTAQIGAAGTHVTTLHFGQFRQKFKPFSKNFS